MKHRLVLLLALLCTEAATAQRNVIFIQAASPGGIIVEDELGRRTGYDPFARTSHNEIPNTQYGDYDIDDHEIGGPVELVQELRMSSVSRGIYSLKVMDLVVDTFKLHIEMVRPDDDVTVFNFKDIAGPNRTVEYRIYYDPDPTKTLTAELVVPQNILSVPSQYATIQAAVDASQPGDIIEVSTGFYNELVSVANKDSISLRTMGSLDGVTCKVFLLKQSHYITIKGFVVDASGTGEHGILLMGGNNENSDITLEANTVKNAGNDFSGISIARGNHRTRIVNNRIHNNGRNGIRIIDATGGPHYLINNTIVQNGWNGVEVARQHVIYLVNNILSFNGTKPGSTGGRYGVSREAMTDSGEAAGITLLNNLIVGNHGNVTSSSSQDIGNYAQTLDATDSGNLTTAGDEGNGVSASPTVEFADVFVSQTPLDLHLTTSSAAIDRGLNNYNPPNSEAGSIPTNDFDGEGRPKGAAVDIGTDESP